MSETGQTEAEDEDVCQMVFESAFDKGAEMCSESGLRSIIRDRLNLPDDVALRKAEQRAWQEAEDERQPSFSSPGGGLDL